MPSPVHALSPRLHQGPGMSLTLQWQRVCNYAGTQAGWHARTAPLPQPTLGVGQSRWGKLGTGRHGGGGERKLGTLLGEGVCESAPQPPPTTQPARGGDVTVDLGQRRWGEGQLPIPLKMQASRPPVIHSRGPIQGGSPQRPPAQSKGTGPQRGGAGSAGAGRG